MKQMKFILLAFLTMFSKLIFGQVTDIDSNVYKTKLFGKKLWMIENLRVTRFNNGDSIPLVLDNQEWINLKSSGYSYYENKIENINSFGNLYNGYVINTNVCPNGWHVPNEKEWKALSKEFEKANRKNKGSNNKMVKIPGHRRGMEGQYYIFETNDLFEGNGPWWCSSKSEEIGWNRFLDYVYISYGNKDYREYGLSIRCVKD